MPSRLHISIWLFFTAAIWALLLWLQGTPILSWNYLKPFGGVVAANGIGATLLNRTAWAWPLINGILIKRPDLRGTWAVTMKSCWIDPSTGKGIPTIEAFVVVRQTLTCLSFRLITKESSSKLISHSFEEQSDGLFRLSAVYRNEPKIELQGLRSEIHHGSLLLNIHGSPAYSLEGHYWTDRGTKGSMSLSSRQKELCDTYEHASKLFESAV